MDWLEFGSARHSIAIMEGVIEAFSDKLVVEATESDVSVDQICHSLVRIVLAAKSMAKHKGADCKAR